MDLPEIPADLGLGVANVSAVEDLAVDGAGQDEIGVRGMGGQVPDRAVGLHGKGKGLPGGAPVAGTVESTSWIGE